MSRCSDNWPRGNGEGLTFVLIDLPDITSRVPLYNHYLSFPFLHPLTSHEFREERCCAVLRSGLKMSLKEHGDLDSPVCSRTEYDEVRDKLRAVQEENCKLQAIITEVTAVNKRWQKYNNDRQLYVQSLLSSIQELQEHVNKIVGQQVVTPKEDRPDDGGREGRHREHLQVLELQLKSYRDDWEAERAEKQQALGDKLRAERRAGELELELRSLRRKLEGQSGQGAAKHCDCCRLSRPTESSSLLAGGLASITYRTSAQLPTALENFQSYNDDLEIDGNKQRKKASICSSSSVVASTLCSGPCNNFDGHTSKRCTRSCEDSEAKLSHVSSPTDGVSQLNIPAAPKRDNVTTLNIVREVPHGDRSRSGVTIGFTSDGRAAITTFANFPVAKSSSLPVERASEGAASSISTSASEDIGRLKSWLPSLDIATPPRSADVPTRDACALEPSGRRRKANYYEDGVATQTEENIICPGCGHVFPPKHQLDFLDHFEMCQSK
ncbi:uncharacterized protein LOC134530424 isoform X7 [Bacillus rossius redtenbacheri]|uniref:uncharacterized protein LOC134530424 isoform X7 n=1 Tax=Bacillus rossius redtenbacheri TaxID=93214 RepID=UPI002FDDAE74